MDGLRRNDVRVRFIGMRHRVPARLSGLMEAMEARTRDCRGLNLSIAIDYGGRDELTRAVRALSRQVEEGRLRPAGISEAAMAAALDTAGCRIRTSSSGPRASSGYRTSCSGRAPTPSTTFPGSPGRTSPSRHFGAAVEGFRLRQRRFGGADIAEPGSRLA